MYQDRSDLETLFRHRPEVGTGYSENLRRFQGNRIPRRAHEARIRQQAGNISSTPLHDLVEPRATIHEQGQSPGKDNIKSFHLGALQTQHFSSIQLSKGPMRGEPLQLRLGRAAQRFVFRQPLDEILFCQWIAISWGRAEGLPNKISDLKFFLFAQADYRLAGSGAGSRPGVCACGA